MPKVTSSQAKNYIARAFRAIADPHPSKRVLESLWEHFNSRCAYCDTDIVRAPKQAHYDHLVSGAGNQLSNFVLACPDCNERKRDLDWETFLRRLSPDGKSVESRRTRILTWQRATEPEDHVVDPVLLERAEACIATVHRVFEHQLAELRGIKGR